MKIRPLRDRLIVDKDEQPKKTPGGIIIPDMAQPRVQKGTVVAAGTGIRSKDGAVIPLAVKPGDRIYFKQMAGIPLTVEGEEILMMKESEIYGIIG